MRPATIVGYALLLIMTAYSAITILGSRLSALQSGTVFFCIIALISIMVLLILKPKPGKRWFIVMEMIVLCVSASILLAGLKSYSIHAGSNAVQHENLQNDIASLSQTNQYYADYIDYLNNETKAYQLENTLLQSQIAEQRSRLNSSLSAIQQNTAPNVIEVPVADQEYNEGHYEQEDEGEDDD